MIHCVYIGGQLHLYLYGDLVCYTWWQKIILFAVLPMVVLFPLSFGISLNMLKERSISPAIFLLSSLIPYVSFSLCLKEKMIGLSAYHPSNEEERCIEEILEMEEELFLVDGNSFRWPVIQLYRNLLVVVVSTFILNPIYRSVVLLPIFLLFSLHDARRMPFQHIFLNYVQMLTSACLLIINACNVIPSFAVMFDVMAMSAMGDILKASRYFELVLLAIVPLSPLVWIGRDMIREKWGKKHD